MFCRYRHFQNYCYKVINRPLKTFEDAQTFCLEDGGSLAVVKSKQALSWLLQIVDSSEMVWFGGVVQVCRHYYL